MSGRMNVRPEAILPIPGKGDWKSRTLARSPLQDARKLSGLAPHVPGSRGNRNRSRGTIIAKDDDTEDVNVDPFTSTRPPKTLPVHGRLVTRGRHHNEHQYPSPHRIGSVHWNGYRFLA